MRRTAWRPTWYRPPPSPAAFWPRRATRRGPRACCSKTWRLAPHPDLAAAYAYARPGDSPRDRLNRVRHLARLTPHDNEGPIALAITAIEAREWDEARKALEPLLDGRLTQRVCTLMARIEGEQHGACRPRARMAGARRQCAARSGLDRRRRGLRSMGAGLAGDGRARCLPLARAGGGHRRAGRRVLVAKVEALVGLGAGPERALVDSGENLRACGNSA